jgi:hypothetical protein
MPTLLESQNTLLIPLPDAEQLPHGKGDKGEPQQG